MAGTLTHYKIALNIYPNIKTKVDKDIYLTACQGHDLLYFIKLRQICIFKKRQKNVKLLANHNFALVCQKFQEYLIAHPDDLTVKSFFYGYLTHHLTDSIYHPFIYYYTHEVTKDKETHKYASWHATFESVIDTLYYPKTYLLTKELPKIKKDSRLANVCENIFKEVYKEENIGKALAYNMANVRPFLRLYRFSRTRIKRWGYLIIEKLTGFKVSYLAYKYPKSYYKINLDTKLTWHHPVTNEEQKDSLTTLEKKATTKVLRIIKEIEKANQKGQIYQGNLDISATHGLDTQKKYSLKYFY